MGEHSLTISEQSLIVNRAFVIHQRLCEGNANPHERRTDERRVLVAQGHRPQPQRRRRGGSRDRGGPQDLQRKPAGPGLLGGGNHRLGPSDRCFCHMSWTLAATSTSRSHVTRGCCAFPAVGAPIMAPTFFCRIGQLWADWNDTGARESPGRQAVFCRLQRHM